MINNLLKPGRLQRAIALFFLLFTVAELTVIDTFSARLCNDELGVPVAADQKASANNNTDKVLMLANKDSRQDHSSSPVTSDEDCFCCCAHILLAPVGVAPPLQAKAQASEAVLPPLLASHLNKPFHPPRFV